MTWPAGGPWVVAATSTKASWAVAAAALAAASASRVAVLHIVRRGDAHEPPPALLTDNLAAYVDVHAGDVDPVRANDVVATIQALSRTHGLVLVCADHGLVVPVGRDGWTLADLAWAMQAPVVVVTDTGPDAANHTTLTLEALSGRGLAASVVTVGDVGDDFLAALPVTPAGRIPADAAEQPQRFRSQAPGWLNPLLHATRGRPAATRPPGPEQPTAAPDGSTVTPSAATPGTPSTETTGSTPTEAPDGTPADVPGETPSTNADATYLHTAATFDRLTQGLPRTSGRPTVNGKRVALGLVGVFVVLVLLACGVAAYGPGSTTSSTSTSTEYDRIQRIFGPAIRVDEPTFVPDGIAEPQQVPTGSAQEPVEEACPQNAGTVVPTRPDAAVTARVNAAWKRIETWLAKHAPASRARLGKPAPAARIDAAQKQMSVRFPPDLVASLRRHNGVAEHAGFTLPPFFAPMPLDEIVDDWTMHCSILTEEAEGMEDWWHPRFVPFAGAADGGSLVVDQRPGGHGRVGEFYAEEGTSFEEWPASVADLLEGTAGSLETGKVYLGQYRPRVVGGSLEWIE